MSDRTLSPAASTPDADRPSRTDRTIAAWRRSLLRGDWIIGERGPSISELMRNHYLTRTQAQRVLAVLESEHLLVRSPGAPPTIMYGR